MKALAKHYICYSTHLLDFFCSGIQFYLLLSPYLCFITLLYLDLYVLGDDAFVTNEKSIFVAYVTLVNIHLYSIGNNVKHI